MSQDSNERVEGGRNIRELIRAGHRIVQLADGSRVHLRPCLQCASERAVVGGQREAVEAALPVWPKLKAKLGVSHPVAQACQHEWVPSHWGGSGTWEWTCYRCGGVELGTNRGPGPVPIAVRRAEDRQLVFQTAVHTLVWVFYGVVALAILYAFWAR